MSIFTKDCPVCGVSQPSETVRCSCGHRFDAASDGDAQHLESIYHEERLYRDYLAARVDGAVKSADKKAIASARAELEAQEQRVRAVKKRLKLMRAERAKSTAAAVPPAQAVPETATAPVRSSGPTNSPAPAEPKSPASASPPAAAPPSNNGQARAVRAQRKPVAPRRPAPAAAKSAPPPSAAAPTPPARSTTSAPPTTPRAREKPAPAVQSGAADKVATQECPNCSAKVPVGVARCGCGFEIASVASEMPSLPMSPEDRDAFLAALDPKRK